MTIQDVLTIKSKGEVCAECSDPPAEIDQVDIYREFFTQPELYQRIHIHIVGIRAKDPTDTTAGLKANGFFGVSMLAPNYRSRFAKASASISVDTYGSDTGSADYFDIGKHKFVELKSNPLPTWDAKALVISKKGTDNTQGLKLTVLNGSTELFEVDLPSTEFPEIGDTTWKEYVYTPPEDARFAKGVEFVYKLRITDCAEKLVSKETLASFLADTQTISYSEEVIVGESEKDNALLQCWRHKKTAKKAVLWFLGRNDCFMHPHAAKPLFLDQGYDLYLLNYSCDGMCRKRGWLDDSLFNSHNYTGDFNIYIPQIEGAIKIIRSSATYDQTVGYAHSTGGPVLINYLMKKGDAEFDSFIFNSPFLDWGADAVGSELFEVVLEHLNAPLALKLLSNDSTLGAKETPKEVKEKLGGEPLKYLNSDIRMSAWSCKLWSQYYFDFRSRNLYDVPMTVGFATGVTAVHNELLKWQSEKKFVTLKPFMCITSRADDTLTAAETLKRIDIIGPGRCEFELRHNAHDVFLSEHKEDVDMALALIKAWMSNNGFA